MQLFPFLFAGFLSSRENSDLSRSCPRSILTFKYQQLHLPLFSGLFILADCPLSTPTGWIYGVFKKDGFKPRSTILHQISAVTRLSSSFTSDPAPRQPTLGPFPASVRRRMGHTRLHVYLTCWLVGPTHCSIHLRCHPPLQLLLFEFLLLCHVTIFQFMLFFFV